MKRIISILLLCILVSGCSHCSKTVSHFEGKTTGINPYGNGNLIVDRESYWGDLNCIKEISNAVKEPTNN